MSDTNPTTSGAPLGSLGPTSDLEGQMGAEAVKNASLPETEPPTEEVDPVVFEAPPAKVSTRKGKGGRQKVKSARHVVSGGKYDEVLLSKAEYKSRTSRKSLTVHHIQRRLSELGYPEAFSDLDGYYGDLTYRSVAKFQQDEGIDTDAPGTMDAETFNALFDGDDNVKVIIDR